MNLLKSLGDAFAADTDLSAIVGTQIYRDRASTTSTTPLLVYTRTKTTQQLGRYQNTHGHKCHTILVDAVGPYESQDTLDTLRDLIVEKWGGWSGTLTADWSGQIVVNEMLDLYDPDTRQSVRRVELLCREVF